MKTQDLIRALVADNATVELPIGRTFAAALLLGLVGAIAVFTLTLGPRADFAYSILHAPRYQFKFVFTVALAVAAFALTWRLTRPEGRAGRMIWLLTVPIVLLVGALGVELWSVPRAHWSTYAVGQNWAACLAMIPLISLVPLGALLYALRQGAPSRPAMAGAAAGLLAAGIGATLYASHCSDDSPLFLALWYTAGASIVTLAGALAGSRLLKW